MRFVHLLDDTIYTGHKWFDTGLWAEVGGIALIICTININTAHHANVGFRLVDKKYEPLLPYRTSTNSRRVTHFTFEPDFASGEDFSPITFHIIANSKYVKLQMFPDDTSSGKDSIVRINGYEKYNYTWNHKPISTMTAIPLLQHYQGGANTVFTYPKSRMPDKDKTKPRPAGPSDS